MATLEKLLKALESLKFLQQPPPPPQPLQPAPQPQPPPPPARLWLRSRCTDGWRPRRTTIFASWDAEKFGLLGSTNGLRPPSFIFFPSDLCPVTLSSYMFKLCHNGNSAAESAVIYPMWPSAEENVKTLQERGVAYVNADSYTEGNYTLRVDCTPLLFQLVYKLTKEWRNQTSFIWRNAVDC
ncbi:uncharacterized protein LOC116151677 isoform X3 [Camelus dromedarius]